MVEATEKGGVVQREQHEWRCQRCDKLLGVLEGGRVHVRFGRGHEYLVGLPATAVCRSCRTLNEAREQSEFSHPATRLS